MPSLVEKMQPWTQTHSFIPTNLLRRSWSSSSANSATPLTSSPSTTSLLSSGGSGSNSNSGGSEVVPKKSDSGSSSKTSSTRAGTSTGSSSLFGKICSVATGSKSSGNGSSKGSGGNSDASSNSIINASTACNGPRPKRKTPILSACMNNWVKFDHDCQKPLPCAECESNQERNRKVLFNSAGSMLISKGKHHRHSHNFFGGGNSHTHLHHNSHVNGTSRSEPSSPTDCVVESSAVVGDSHSSGNAFPGEVVSWENVKNKSSFKIVINVPCLDMNLFQNENVQVEIVCNKNKLATGKDFATVQRTRAELKCSGWYWEGIDSEASMEILESAQPGAFIVRDSSDPRFLYSLSIQTERGPTSVRLPYRKGKFSLDGDEKIAERVPKFDSVIGLIEHYVNGGTRIGKKVSVWVDHEGNMHSTVKLTKPVRRNVGSLKHLARVAINKHNLLTNNNNNNNISAEATSTADNNSLSISSPSTSGSDCQKVSAVTSISTTSANSHIPCPTSVDGVTSDGSVSSISSVPATENVSTTSSFADIAPVTDLSKLPTSLQNYMLEYPYRL